MKNVIDEKPNFKLTGRFKFASKFVNSSDIKNKEVLDIGCGYGWFENYAVSKGVKKIIGLEITENDLKVALNNIKDRRVSFKVGTALDIPLRDNSVDTVVSWEVIEHIPKNTETKMFKEVNRVLSENGNFYLSTPFNSFFSKILDPAFWLIGHRHYSIKKLQDLAKKNGFKVIEYQTVGSWWSALGLLNMYFCKWILRRKRIANKFFVNKVDREYKQEKGFMGVFIHMKKIS